MRPRVLVTRSLPGPALGRLAGSTETEVWPGSGPIPREALREQASRAEGLLCLLTDRIDAEILGQAPVLKVISNYAVGFDNIDVEAATRRKIAVGNTPGVLTETTADLAFALLMAAARRIAEGAACARAGAWEGWSPTLLLGRDIHGSTLGILGIGRIGQAVARRARGFGMRVIYCDRGGPRTGAIEGAEAVGFDRLLAESDFLSIHVPLTGETHHLIDRHALARMKETAILINTARGPVVDHDALCEALRSGRIAGAALDVTEPEPLPSGHGLLDLTNCLIVPHLGSATVDTRSRMAMMAVDNLIAGLRGERLPHCVNPSVYER